MVILVEETIVLPLKCDLIENGNLILAQTLHVNYLQIWKLGD